jgi:D-arabinose 1-dehydrogenase-like Zn-dependent alcohol dehydrogenase
MARSKSSSSMVGGPPVLIDRGQMRPVVDEVLPLNQVARAHQRLESGHGRGKVVLRETQG